MNRYSVKIEPRRGSSIARIWNRDNAAPEKDDTWTGCWEVDTFLVDITIFDTRDGWGVHITLCPELENLYLWGTGATPADAIRNSNYPPPLRDL